MLECDRLSDGSTVNVFSELELVDEEELIKARQRLNLSKFFQQYDLPIELHDIISDNGSNEYGN